MVVILPWNKKRKYMCDVLQSALPINGLYRVDPSKPGDLKECFEVCAMEQSVSGSE